jgi:hypothetical protein
VRQERVLLRLVEAVDLVAEEDGAAPHGLAAAASPPRRSRDPGNAFGDGTEVHERASVRSAMMRASVVLPVPGGPQKMTLPMASFSMSSRSAGPAPSRCSWPT